MSKEIKLEEVRSFLNQKQHIYPTVAKIVSFLKQPKIKNPLLNKLRNKYLLSDKTNVNLLAWFIEETEYIVEGTAICPNKYARQILLKTVWQQVNLHVELMNNVKNNIVLDEPEKAPLTKEERLKRQAELMRAAKAKKREEKLKQEALAKQAAEPALTIEKEEQPKQHPQGKQFTPEEIERIQWLKKL